MVEYSISSSIDKCIDVTQLLDNRITKLQNQNERKFKMFKKTIWKNKAKDRRRR